jgi:hypothetical protein
LRGSWPAGISQRRSTSGSVPHRTRFRSAAVGCFGPSAAAAACPSAVATGSGDCVAPPTSRGQRGWQTAASEYHTHTPDFDTEGLCGTRAASRGAVRCTSDSANPHEPADFAKPSRHACHFFRGQGTQMNSIDNLARFAKKPVSEKLNAVPRRLRLAPAIIQGKLRAASSPPFLACGISLFARAPA